MTLKFKREQRIGETTNPKFGTFGENDKFEYEEGEGDDEGSKLFTEQIVPNENYVALE